MRRPARTLALLLALAGAAAANACSIPVFRYALERWPAAPYGAIVFHRGKLEPAARALLEQLKGAASAQPAANLECIEVDVEQPLPAELGELWKSLNNPALPFLVVRYPEGRRESAIAFSSPLNADALRGLLDSPARRELAKRLLGGESAVWLVLKSGSTAQDQAACKLLQDELKGLAQELKLPEQDPDGDAMARPAADLPLRLSFSILSLSREDAAERAFVQMLLGTDKDLAAEKGVLAFPVFGRGRLLCALPEKQLTHETIAEVAEFVTGACSCQVKDLNPGTDLLLAADWEALLEGRAVEEPAPPLTGITANRTAGVPRICGTPAQYALAEQRSFQRQLVIALGGLLFAVVVATVLLKRRAARKRN
ncbi:MAG: hypothetical protein ABSE73_11855 [Planctomycetota bacterium]